MADKQRNTPEDQKERAQYKASEPDMSQRMYDKNQSVWYKSPQGQRVAMTIAESREDKTGRVQYQLKTSSDGNLHENGAWIEEGKLENNAH